MGFFGFDILLILLVLFGGGANGGRDLLDMVPTEAYWQAKQVAVTAAQLEADAGPEKAPEGLAGLLEDLASPEFKTRAAAKKKIYAMGPAVLPLLKGTDSKNAEVSASIADLSMRLQAHQKERDVERLMAIRTLGERKERGALDLLRGLEASKELFVGEYARRAVAEIEGKAFTATDHREAVAGDLALLPGDAGIVGQSVGLSGAGEAMTVEGLADAALASAKNSPMGRQAGAKIPARGDVVRRLVVDVLKVADRIGDVRFDGVTVEVSKDAGSAGGAAVVILRGAYDREAVIGALQAMAENDGPGSPGLKVKEEGGVKEIEEGEEPMMALLPSNEELMLLMTSDREKRMLPLKAELLAALKGGKGGVGAGTPMGRLLQKVDTHSPLWVAAQLNADMRKDKLFEGFETITLATTVEKSGTTFVLTGEGHDAELVKGSVEELKNDIAGGIASVQMVMAQEKELAPVLDFLQKLKVDSAGTHGTLTGSVEKPLIQAMVNQTGPMLLMGGLSDDAGEGASTQP